MTILWWFDGMAIGIAAGVLAGHHFMCAPCKRKRAAKLQRKASRLMEEV